MQYIAIGWGAVAPLHRAKFEEHGIKPVAVIETNEAKHEDIRKLGLKVCKTYEEALQLKPDFWDITCPVESHVKVIEKIIALAPHACIINEKPVCNFEEISHLQTLLKDFKGKIVVNENYLSSEITKRIKSIVESLNLEIKKVHIEFDKNRTKDFMAGRYVDPKGAFYYEGTHMVTILNHLIKPHTPTGEISKRYEDLVVPECTDKGEIIPKKTLTGQGVAEIAYVANGISVTLFTSMKGDIKYPSPSIIPVEDTATRHRIAVVEGVNKEGETVTVTGYYEPSKGLNRSEGFVTIRKGNVTVQMSKIIKDDTMGIHLNKAADYFRGVTQVNPSSVDDGIDVVKMINTIAP